MRVCSGLSVILLTLILAAPAQDASGAVPPRRIDRERTLFGIEYTFQDQAMVDEPGRRTYETPHKKAKLDVFLSAYLRALGVSRDRVAPVGGPDDKPGVAIDVPGDGVHVMDMEPVCIEVNTTPKRADQVLPAGEKVFAGAAGASLVPYVRPAAERSGMGNIHVGGATLGDNPFFAHPTLLRNVLVYFHQHPSLLHGFAEAYDIGKGSNIETLHDFGAERAFEEAVAEWDRWYLGARKAKEPVWNGLRRFLEISHRDGNAARAWFGGHYRNINLEHIADLRPWPRMPEPSLEELKAYAGKITVEFRAFRPPKTPAHAKSNVEMLLTLFDGLADPDRLVPFRSIPAGEVERFKTGSRIQADWEKVRAEMGIADPIADGMIAETVQAVHSRRYPAPGLAGAELYAAYSPKEQKGRWFELRLPAESYDAAGVEGIRVGGRPQEFEKVSIGGREYWVGYVDADGLPGGAEALRRGGVPLSVEPVPRGRCLARALRD